MNKQQLMSKVFKKAHALAKSIRKSGDSYRDTFALCLKYVRAQAETVVDVINEIGSYMNMFSAKIWKKGRTTRVYVKGYARDLGKLEMFRGKWDCNVSLISEDVHNQIHAAMKSAGIPICFSHRYPLTF